MTAPAKVEPVACPECGSTSFERRAQQAAAERQTYDTARLDPWTFDVRYEETTEASRWACWQGHALDDDALERLDEAINGWADPAQAATR